jgi:hypothetical protein
MHSVLALKLGVTSASVSTPLLNLVRNHDHWSPRVAHEIRLREINGVSIYYQVSSRLKMGSWILFFHC